MESRMKRYHEIDIDDFKRSKKNENLYKEVYGNYDDFENLPIPDNSNEIEIDNHEEVIGSREDKKKKQAEKELEDLKITKIDDKNEFTDIEKLYDINLLLEKAKEENAKIKKESSINKNIPNYLANLESDKTTKDIILKYDGDNDEDMPIMDDKTFSTFHSLDDSNVSKSSNLSLDILSDLKPTGDTVVSSPITEKDEDLFKEKDEDFYSGNFEFTSEDFETVSDDEDDDLEEDDDEDDEVFYEEKEHLGIKILLLIIGFLALGVSLFFIFNELLINK